MNNSDIPLFTLLVERLSTAIKRHWDEPPKCEIDFRLVRAAWAQRVALVRALLLTLATGLLVFIGDNDLGAAANRIRPYWEWAQRHWVSVAVVTCFVCTVFAPRIQAFCIRAWAFNRRQRWAPLMIAVGLGILIVSRLQQSPCFIPPLFGVALTFTGFGVSFWFREEEQPDLSDLLHRRYFAERLLDQFLLANPTIRRIAILGSWGSGKTTVLELLRQKLQRSTVRQFRVAVVNPWTAKTAEEACSMIAQGFDELLGRSFYLANGWKNHRWLSWLNGVKTGSGLGLSFDLKTIMEGSSSDAEAILAARVNHELRLSKFTPIILVDDMERAEPEIIRKIFPLIDSLRLIKGCYFVFAIDPNRVAKAFGEKSWLEGETKGYLDKVFDLKFELPEPRSKDIAKMCHGKIDRDETPKLFAAYEAIRPYLPTNPRSALLFLQDARAKEILFLSRYDDEEEDFESFFQYRLLEHELPGVADQLQGPEADEYRKIAGVFNPGAQLNPDEVLSNVWNKALEGRLVSRESAERLKGLFRKFITLPKPEMTWIRYDHMRLLTPSALERQSLLKGWINECGMASLLEMVSKFLPDKEFADLEDSADELIEAEFSAFKEARRQVAQFGRAQFIQPSLTTIDRLGCHYRYALRNKIAFDLKPFDKYLFESLIDEIFHHSLDQSNSSHKDLAEKELRICIDLVANLPVDYVFSLAMQSGREIASRYVRTLIDDQIAARFELIHLAASDTFIAWLLTLAQADDFERSWRKAGLATAQLVEAFHRPGVWFLGGRSDEQDVLKAVALFGHTSEESSLEFKRVCKALLYQLSREQPGWTGDGKSTDSSVTEMILAYKEFFKAAWSSAMANQDIAAHVKDLLEVRSETLGLLQKDGKLSAECFEATFPLPG